jgi:hypothetical protein
MLRRRGAFARSGEPRRVSGFSTRSAIEAVRLIRPAIAARFVRRAGWYGSRNSETA